MPARRGLVLINTHSRRGAEDAGAVTAALRTAGIDVTRIEPDREEPLIETLRRRRDGHEMLIAAGGDGTINRVLEPASALELPLGIVPLGTANDLARTLGIEPAIEPACRVIADGHTRRINLGRVNDRLFVNVASLGISTAVARLQTRERKRRWRLLAYLLSSLEAWRASRPFEARISCDGIERRMRCLQISVGNGRYYGGGMSIAEDASPSGDWLDLSVLRPHSLWQLAWLFPALRAGRHGGRPRVTALRAQEILVRTRRPHQINADGELVARSPARFTLVRGALTVYAPPSPDAQEEDQDMLREPHEAALVALLEAVRRAARGYESGAAILDGAPLAETLSRLAAEAGSGAARLATAMSGAGLKPPAPDEELAFFEDLLRHGKAALSDAEADSVIAECEELEQAVLDEAGNAESNGLAASLAQQVALQKRRAEAALAALRARGPASQA